ncbi:MAG TPA: hypothetical protein VMJ90_06010 [Anaerolineales bacterium]|nr:hypothetical protein [Anaerolineales bacterium]
MLNCITARETMPDAIPTPGKRKYNVFHEPFLMCSMFMHLALDEHYLREQIARPLLEEFPADANLGLRHEGGLAFMNGIEWFEGYAGHEAFHHKQIDALITQLKNHAREGFEPNRS